jgi:hypothetical protein
MDFGAILEFAKLYGPLSIAVAFFLWRDHWRETKHTVRINHLEDEFRQVVLPLVRETTNVITQNTAAFLRLERILDRQ